MYSINGFEEYADSMFGVFRVFTLEIEAAGSSTASTHISQFYTMWHAGLQSP